MEQDDYTKLNAKEVISKIRDGSLKPEEALTFERAGEERTTVIEAAQQAIDSAKQQTSADDEDTPAKLTDQPASDTTTAKLRQQAQENWSGATVKVRTSGGVPERMTFAHPQTFQTIGRDAVEVPDDSFTRQHLGAGHFEVVG